MFQQVLSLITSHPLTCLSLFLSISTLALLLGRKYALGPKVPIKILKSTNLQNKIIIVTGCAYGGIGYETVKQLYGLGATVIIGVRNVKQGELTKQEIIKKMSSVNNNKLHGEIIVMELDLADLNSVTKFVKEFKEKFNELNILINNAGIMLHPFDLTKQNIEIHLGVNHIGHFLLTNLLLNTLKETSIKNNNEASRVITVSSRINDLIEEKHVLQNGFCNFSTAASVKHVGREESSFNLYGRSKFANILFTKKLNRILNETVEQQNNRNGHVIAVSVHPGVVDTGLWKHVPKVIAWLTRPFFYYISKTPFYGSQTTIYCAIAPSKELKSGLYYADCKDIPCNPLAERYDLQDNLWNISMDICKSYLQ
ncbi:hypothetical protein ABK040_008028 [Willaertia magna]